MVRIIYEADSPTDFHVRGRVKGTPEGFVRSNSKPELGHTGAYFFEIIGIGLIVLFSVPLFSLLTGRDARSTWQRVHKFATVEDYIRSTRSKFNIVAQVCMVITGIFVCIFGWHYSQSPAWASDIIHSPTAFQTK